MNLTKEQLAELSAWAAEKIGVYLFDNEPDRPVWTDPGGHVCLWDIRDARCRELVREKLQVMMVYGDGWLAWADISDMYYSGAGDSIQSAEINCLWAIFEGERL
jgi:hypothetical protein